MSPAPVLVTRQTGHCVTSTRPCHRTKTSLCHQHSPLSPAKQVTVSPALAPVTGQTGHCVTSTRPCHRTNRSLCHQHSPLSPDKQVTVSPALAPVTEQTGQCVNSTPPCHRTNRSLCHQHPPLSPDKLSPCHQQWPLSPNKLVTVSAVQSFSAVDSDLTKCTTSLKRIFKRGNYVKRVVRRGNYVSQRSGQKRKLCQSNEWSEEETIQLKCALKRGNCLDQRRV